MFARALTLVLLATLIAACDGGGSPEPTPTATRAARPTRTAVSPSATPTQPQALAPTLRPIASPRPTASPCADPRAVRLQPSGTPPALARYQALPFVNDPALEQTVRRSLGEHAPRVSVVVKNLADGRGVALDADRVFYAASLFKTWVMLEAYHQRETGLLDFDERYVVADHYGQFGLNPGELAPCDEVTAGDALRAMIGTSDNVAANLLTDRVGAGNTRTSLRNLGLTSTTFAGGGSLPATARDMALLLEAIGRRQAVSAQASDEMLSLLASEYTRDRLSALLPAGVRVAHKSGNWSNATHDVGVVFGPRASYVIAVLSDFGFGPEGARVIARLSRAVYDYYHPS